MSHLRLAETRRKSKLFDLTPFGRAAHQETFKTKTVFFCNMNSAKSLKSKNTTKAYAAEAD